MKAVVLFANTENEDERQLSNKIIGIEWNSIL